jgi:CHASE3 domain sensor protein
MEDFSHHISALFDSVYTINTSIARYEEELKNITKYPEMLKQTQNSITETVKCNVQHIKACLRDEAYKVNLTAEQTQELNNCVDKGTNFMNNLVAQSK